MKWHWINGLGGDTEKGVLTTFLLPYLVFSRDNLRDGSAECVLSAGWLFWGVAVEWGV